MSDTRPYPKILRTTEAADALLRAYAAEYEIKPFEALVVAIGRLADPVESESLRASLDAAGKLAERLTADLAAERKASAALRADLESAREATRRADAEVERLTAEATVRAREYALAAAKLGTETDRLTRELAEAITSRARIADELAAAIEREQRTAAPCACALPADLAARVEARIKARPGRDFAFVVKNGCDRLEGSDRYVDKKKAERTGIDQ